MTTMPRSRVYAMLLVVLVLWAGNSIMGRAVRDDIPPLTLALCRWTTALAVLLPFTWRQIRAEWPVIVAHWPMIALLGIIGIGGFNGLLYSGLRETTATNALLIQAAIPALVLLFDFALFRSRPRFAQVAGVAVAAIGVAIIIFKADAAAMLALRFGRGDLLVLGAVVAWGLYTSLLRRRPPIHPLGLLTLLFAVGAATMLPGAATEWGHYPINPTPAVIAGILYVAVFTSVIAYQMFNRAVAEIGAADAGLVLSLQPLIGAALAALLLGEALHAYHFGGMVLILLGIAIPSLRRNI